ncbi:MAG: ferritin-like domain-containing protein [Fimbriimonadaceae bacterium]|nr:MAG: ferritin-like domain-containing protein [Fimbriimonadaceae bacterium]
MDTNKLLKNATEELLEGRLERRRLLQMGLSGGAAILGGTLLAGCGGSGSSSSSGVTDADVLNFALNLEYLEAEYYLRATTGTGLSGSDVGASPGAVSGGSAVPFSTPAFQQYANEIAADELAHVRFLRAALGSAAVDRPAINLSTSFDAAAQAAGIGASFNPFADEVSFLVGAFVFEDVGVTAYKGASPLISNKTYLEAAAGILGVEAYHAGMVRTVLYSIGGAAVTNAQAISDLRDMADGPDDKDQGITDGANANIVPTDANGIAFSRSTSEVLGIVYLGGSGSGGFYPNGLNGNIA